MPNWCQNRLTISAAEKELDEIASAYDGGPEQPFSLALIRPIGAAEIEGIEAQLEADAKEISRWRESDSVLEHYQVGAAAAALSIAALLGPRDSDREFLAKLRYWGTKWDLSFEAAAALGGEDVDPQTLTSRTPLLRTPGLLSYRFLSAYAPPVPALCQLAADHPKAEMTLRYAEAGSDVAGELIWREGTLEVDKDLEVSDVLAPEEYWF